MNLAGDGLLLLVALHELADRESAHLSALPENDATSGAFLAPPPRPNPTKMVACLSFARSTSMNSSAFGRGWLAHKRAEDQNHRPARRPFSGCRRRVGLLPTEDVAPRRLAGADETRIRQVIVAPTSFGESRGEVSTARHETGLRPVDAPFHETSVTGLRPVGQDCSAATPGPSAYAAPSSNAPSTLAATLCPFPLPPTATSSLSARLQFGGAHLVFAARACRRCPREGWLRRVRPAGQNQRPARRTVPSCTRRAGLLASRTLPALLPHFPRCRAFSRWTSSPDGATIASPTHRGARMGEHITSSSVERARRDAPHGTALFPCLRTPTDALATSQQGLAPDPRCARAGEARGVGWMSPSAKRGSR
jgi:hypothetical protein